MVVTGDEKETSLRRNESYADSYDSLHKKKSDADSIALLLFLYLLQGIPIGLAASVPMVLQSHHVSYAKQAIFSIAPWPFSLKLFWAPIVDSCYSKRFGRRKSWLVPVQYLIGIFMLILSYYSNTLIGNGADADEEPNVELLTAIFFALYFLTATQDIAVDGWGLTMLSRRNIGHSSTCNSVGQTAGFFLGYVVFLALESPEFCNTYLRSEPKPEGLVTLSDFMFFWGWVFLITTTFIWWFKWETEELNLNKEEKMSVMTTYKQCYEVIKLPAVRLYCIIILTAKVGYAAADALTGLKMIEAGVPKEKLALLGIPMIPLQIILPLVIAKYVAGPRPMDVFLKFISPRLIIGIVIAGFVYWTQLIGTENGSYSYDYYAIAVIIYGMQQVTSTAMFVAAVAFHTKISDPSIGGTYMTLINTITNIGGSWPRTAALAVVDSITWKSCINNGTLLAVGSCIGHDYVKECTSSGGKCVTEVDGYYIEIVVCAVVGVLWLRCYGHYIRRLQDYDERAWRVPK
jgi:PAT family acetyl-CoA transporter-like MFS transporter 1